MPKTGALMISDNDVLATMSGLPLLARVDGDVEISLNPALLSARLPDQVVGGNLRITRNAVLPSLDVSIYRHLGGFLDLANNARLASLTVSANDTAPLPVSPGAVLVAPNNN